MDSFSRKIFLNSSRDAIETELHFENMMQSMSFILRLAILYFKIYRVFISRAEGMGIFSSFPNANTILHA